MSLRTAKRAAIGLSAGFGVGFLMVILAFMLEKNPAAMGVWNFIQKPALLLADWWTGIGMPPSGEASWIITPAMMVLAQWSLIGLLVSLWRCRKLHRTVSGNSDKTADK